MFLSGKAGRDVLRGGGRDDVLVGGTGNDHLRGGAGDDLLLGGAGSDTLDGGAGWDVASYDGAERGVSIDLAAGRAYDGGRFGPGDTDFLSGIEAVRGGAERDIIHGDLGDNHLAGAGGDDWLYGGAGGRDTLDGGAGDDSFRHELASAYSEMHGGEGEDMFFAENGDLDMVFDLAAGAVSVEGQVSVGVSGIEIFHGASGDDLFRASAGRSTFYGDDGADLFVFAPGAAPASLDPAALDTVLRFGGFGSDEGDRISLGVTGAYEERTAGSYADAAAAAEALIAAGERDIVAVQVGEDVYVFADALRADRLDTAIKLEIADLERLGEGDFI